METTTTVPTQIKSLRQRLNECPPFCLYYGAHYNSPRRPTLPELVKASGMSHRTFTRISQKGSWDGITVLRMQQFANACGVDLLNPQPLLDWLRSELQKPEPFKRFDACHNSRAKMVEHFNLAAAKAVMAKDRAASV